MDARRAEVKTRRTERRNRFWKEKLQKKLQKDSNKPQISSPSKKNDTLVPSKHKSKGRKAVIQKDRTKVVSNRGFRSEAVPVTQMKGVGSSQKFSHSPKVPLKTAETESDTDSDLETHSETKEPSGTQDTSLRETKISEEVCRSNQAIKKLEKKRRYILFLGNLPVNSSREDVVSHFEKRGVHVGEFRLLTYKDTEKSKGCGFMELTSNREMQNALKFHRSRLMGKHLNVEVTCGGGGKAEVRKNRILEKNRTMRKKIGMKNPAKHRT